MALTSIGDARTPNTPVEVTFAADTGTPSANQEILLFGRRAASGGTGTTYQTYTVANSGDAVAAKAEVDAIAGTGSEAGKMVAAAINANAGGSTFPQLKVCLLATSEVDGASAFGSADVGLTNSANIKAEFLVSPYDGCSGTSAAPSATKLKAQALLLSGAQRTANNQFGTVAVVADRAQITPASLPTFDSQFVMPVYLRDAGTSGNAPAYSIGEVAAAAAAVAAANAVPFNPLDDITIQGVAAPKLQGDWISVGDSAESETILGKGWTPLYVKPNQEVAFVRTITARLSADGTGSPVVTSYYDLQDFQVLYYFRKAVYTRLKQPDFKKKASTDVAKNMKAEIIRLMGTFEDQGMFQAVDQLAKQVVVQRLSSDRSAFEVFIPVNVVPGLHRKKVNIQAGTQFDSFVV